MKTLFQLALVSSTIFVFSFSGCKKSDKCDAGTDGEVALRFEPQHHGKPIYSSSNYRDTVYLKFDATDFPGPDPANFDVVVAGNGGEYFVNVSNLHCGQYYVFMTAFDTSANYNTRVLGGIPYNLTESSGSFTIPIPVSE